MDDGRLKDLVESLDSNLDSLEDSIAPLIKSQLTDTTSDLSLLDKAKANLLVLYTIESLIYSTLKLNGIDAKEHPIFRELARTKQYFEKVKVAEQNGPGTHRNPQEKQTLSLDKNAAGRFIKHALDGNEKYDRERAEAQATSKAAATRKFEAMSDQVGMTQRFKSAQDLGKQNHAVKLEKRAAESDSKQASEHNKKHKTHRHAEVGRKSNKAPKAGSEVFKDLLKRSEKMGKASES